MVKSVERLAAVPAKPLPDGARHLGESELDRLIIEHRGTLDDVLMTPMLAAYILRHYNTGNRNLRPQQANLFSQTLQRGGWINTGEAVVFAKEGVLNNGQHRLEGVVRSGIPAVMDVRFGIPRKAFAVTDTGSKRSAGDVLAISGSSSGFASAAAMKLLIAYEQGLPSAYHSAYRMIGHDEILAAFLRWPDIEKAVDLTKHVLSRRGFVNASSNAFTFLAIREAGEDLTTSFLGLVESGLTSSKYDAPRLLRERMLNEKMGHGNRAAVVERLALFIKAWRMWHSGTRGVLRWRPENRFPSMKVSL